jgi:hypothetical protein
MCANITEKLAKFLVVLKIAKNAKETSNAIEIEDGSTSGFTILKFRIKRTNTANEDKIPTNA